MAQAAYLFDRLMQAFIPTGRNIVALISRRRLRHSCYREHQGITQLERTPDHHNGDALDQLLGAHTCIQFLIGFVVPSRIVARLQNLQQVPGVYGPLPAAGYYGGFVVCAVFKMILRAANGYLMLDADTELPHPGHAQCTAPYGKSEGRSSREAGTHHPVAISVEALWLLASYPKYRRRVQRQLRSRRQRGPDANAGSPPR